MKLVASKWYSGGAVVLPVTVYFFNYFSTLSAWAQSSIALYSPEPRRLQKRGTSCVLPHPEVAPPARIVVDKGIVKQHWVKAWVETEMNSSLAFSKDTPHSRLSSIRKWKADELKQPRLAEQYRLHETRELNICQTACKPTANSTHHQASSCRCPVDMWLHQCRNILSHNTVHQCPIGMPCFPSLLTPGGSLTARIPIAMNAQHYYIFRQGGYVFNYVGLSVRLDALIRIMIRIQKFLKEFYRCRIEAVL